MFKLIIILLILCCILVILYKTSTPDLDIIQEEFEDSFDSVNSDVVESISNCAADDSTLGEIIQDVGVDSQLSKIVNKVTSKPGFNPLMGLQNINSSFHSYLNRHSKKKTKISVRFIWNKLFHTVNNVPLNNPVKFEITFNFTYNKVLHHKDVMTQSFAVTISHNNNHVSNWIRVPIELIPVDNQDNIVIHNVSIERMLLDVTSNKHPIAVEKVLLKTTDDVSDSNKCFVKNPLEKDVSNPSQIKCTFPYYTDKKGTSAKSTWSTDTPYRRSSLIRTSDGILKCYSATNEQLLEVDDEYSSCPLPGRRTYKIRNIFVALTENVVFLSPESNEPELGQIKNTPCIVSMCSSVSNLSLKSPIISKNDTQTFFIQLILGLNLPTTTCRFYFMVNSNNNSDLLDESNKINYSILKGRNINHANSGTLTGTSQINSQNNNLHLDNICWIDVDFSNLGLGNVINLPVTLCLRNSDFTKLQFLMYNKDSQSCDIQKINIFAIDKTNTKTYELNTEISNNKIQPGSIIKCNINGNNKLQIVKELTTDFSLTNSIGSEGRILRLNHFGNINSLIECKNFIVEKGFFYYGALKYNDTTNSLLRLNMNFSNGKSLKLIINTESVTVSINGNQILYKPLDLLKTTSDLSWFFYVYRKNVKVVINHGIKTTDKYGNVANIGCIAEKTLVTNELMTDNDDDNEQFEQITKIAVELPNVKTKLAPFLHSKLITSLANEPTNLENIFTAAEITLFKLQPILYFKRPLQSVPNGIVKTNFSSSIIQTFTIQMQIDYTILRLLALLKPNMNGVIFTMPIGVRTYQIRLRFKGGTASRENFDLVLDILNTSEDENICKKQAQLEPLVISHYAMLKKNNKMVITINKQSNLMSVCAENQSGNRIFCNKKYYSKNFASVTLQNVTYYPKALLSLIGTNRITLNPCTPTLLDCRSVSDCHSGGGCLDSSTDKYYGMLNNNFSNNDKKTGQYYVWEDTKCKPNENSISIDGDIDSCKEAGLSQNKPIIQFQNNKCELFSSTDCVPQAQSGSNLYIYNNTINELESIN